MSGSGDGGTHPRSTFMEIVKDYWFLVAFAISISVTVWQGWDNLSARAEQNERSISENRTAMEALREAMEARATRFLTEREFGEVWKKLEEFAASVNENEDSIDTLEDKFNDLILSDQRLQSKIELETEKIRREIEQSSREQTTILNQILREIQQ